MAKKSVEYRDTFTFRLFPEYTYTKAQSRRFRLFQGRIEHWRASINYADSFISPNRINLLYMIGYDPKMKPYLEKTRSNLVILCAKIPRDYLQAYDTYFELVERYRGSGYTDRDGSFTPIYYQEREIREKYRGTGQLSDRLYELHDPEDKIIDGYEQLKEKIADCFTSYTVIDKRGSERTISHNDLDKLIKQYFPYGREQCGVGEKSAVSLKRIGDALQAGLDRADAAKLLDFPAGTDCYTVCQKGIKRCRMNLNVSIRNAGYTDLVEQFDRMKAPPYGWDNEPHAAYCFGYALSDYLDDTWIWDELAFFPYRDVIHNTLFGILKGTLGRRKGFTLVTEPGYALSSRFAYLFGIGTDEYHPRDAVDERILELHRAGMTERQIADDLGTMSNIAVHKRLVKMRIEAKDDIPFCNMAFQVCRKIREMTRWPVALVDEHLNAVICGTYDSTNHISIPVFGKQNVNTELAYFTTEKCKELKKKLDSINTDVPRLIRQRYGDTVDVDEVERTCTTTDSCWLWNGETFWECVDRYMARCKEDQHKS